MLIQLQRLTDSHDSEMKCLLPYPMYQQLDLEQKRNYTLFAGNLCVDATFSYTNDTEAGCLQLSSAILQQLSLYENMKMQIWKNDLEIHLGPIVGVFLNTRYLQELEQGNEVPVFIHNHMLANDVSHCFTYFFSVHDLNWIDQKIHGFSFDLTTDSWQKKWYPMPDVLYDRGASFELEHKSLVNYIRQQFSYSKTLKTVNSLQYLGKWQVYKTLAKYSLVQPYLPETIEYKSFSDVSSMLERHAFLFIKSFYGSRGREIITIENLQKNSSKSPIEQFKVTYFHHNLETIYLSCVDELQKLVESQIVSNKSYLVQQGIPLLQYEGRSADTRVLTQKNESGEWEAVYNHVNIAAENSTITTIDSDDVSYEKFYQYFLNQNLLIPTDSQIRTIAVTIAELLEKELGPMGEMGLDLAIDENCHIWFFEANSKPEKYPGPGIQYSAQPTKQFYNILEYAKYLTIASSKTDKIPDSLTIKPSATGRSDFDTAPIVSVPQRLYQLLIQQMIEKRIDITNVFLRLGQWQIPVIYTANNTNDEIIIPAYILETFPVLWNMKCQYKLTNNTVTLGPVIGVFLSNGSIRKMIAQKPKFRHYELAIANVTCKTILYYFSIKDVDFVNQRINGTYFDVHTKRWQRRPFPLPEVFYDRGGGVLTKQIVKSDYIREQLNNMPYIKKINPQHYFSKWLTHKKLLNYAEMTPYLPKTIAYKKPGDLEEMFQGQNQLFVKDSYGSNGRGIVKISKISEYEYRYSYFSNRVYEETVPSIETLHDAIRSFIKSDQLIIQNAISLININNRNIDLRATMQRNGSGQLDIVSLPVRMGCAHSPVTSTQTGSSVFEFYHFFEKYLNYSKNEIDDLKQKIEIFLITCYKYIEAVYGTFGEIGIDFALDQSGSIWFIECNAKPGYDAMYKSYDKEIRRRAFTNPLEYAKFIANYT